MKREMYQTRYAHTPAAEDGKQKGRKGNRFGSLKKGAPKKEEDKKEKRKARRKKKKNEAKHSSEGGAENDNEGAKMAREGGQNAHAAPTNGDSASAPRRRFASMKRETYQRRYGTEDGESGREETSGEQGKENVKDTKGRDKTQAKVAMP